MSDISTDHAAVARHYTAQAQIAQLTAELDRYKGTRLTARQGCYLDTFRLGMDCEVVAEFQFDEDTGRSCILKVLINGYLMDAEDYMPRHVLDLWELQIDESRTP